MFKLNISWTQEDFSALIALKAENCFRTLALSTALAFLSDFAALANLASLVALADLKASRAVLHF